MELDDLEGIGPSTRESLNNNGIEDIEDLADSDIEDITSAGISNSRAKDIKYKAKQNTIQIQTGTEVQEEYENRNSISTGLDSLDEYTEDGLSNGEIVAAYGSDGCHEKGTGILMYDGSTKNVEDISIGDKVMGPDSTPRTVLNTVEGYDEMYKIKPTKGESFVVNGNHILSLAGISKYDGIINVKVKDYIDWCKTKKKHHMLYKTSVDFEEKELPLEPYFLGLLIGDGSITQGVRVTTEDKEIVEELQKQANKHSMRLVEEKYENKSPRYRIVGSRNSHEKNVIYEKLKELNLDCKSGCKHIPDEYLYSSRKQRLNLLAGYIDADGHLSRGGFDITTKSKNLHNDVIYLARSLGFGAYRSVKKIDGKKYYRTYISGDCSQIPNRLERKSARERQINKNVLHVGFEVEKKSNSGKYFGFQVDKDNLYLMEDFTVTHNSGKTQLAFQLAVSAAENNDEPVIWIETERERFQPSRIQEIAESDDILDNIYQIKAYDLDTQYNSYQKIKSIEEEVGGVSLVIIDSLTARFRLTDEFDERSNLSARSSELGKHVNAIEEMVDKLNCPCFVTCQIYDAPTQYSSGDRMWGGSLLKHSIIYRIYMKQSTGDTHEVTVEAHPATGDNSFHIDINDDGITEM